MNLQRNNTTAGLSLVELLVLTCVVGLCFVLFSSGMSLTLRSSVDTQKREKTAEALDYMENEIKKANFHFVTAADSTQKSGVAFNATTSAGTYFIPWMVSRLRPSLEEFERRASKAGAKRIWISVRYPIRRENQDRREDSLSFFGPLFSNPQRDVADPNLKYMDLNSDGDYFDAEFNLASGKWVSETPYTGLKKITIALTNDMSPAFLPTTPPTPIGRRDFMITDGSYSGDAGTKSNGFEIKARFPSGDFFWHQRTTLAQRNNLDLPWTKTVKGPLGMADCRELRWDNYIDPVLGRGDLVVNGITSAGALIKFQADLRKFGTVSCPGNNSIENQLVLPGGTGEYTFTLNTLSPIMINTIQNDPNCVPSLLIDGTLNGITSQYFSQSLFLVNRLSGPPSLTTLPPNGTVCNTRSPMISASQPNLTGGIEPKYSTFIIDGSPFDAHNPINNSPGFIRVSAPAPYLRMPPILADNATHIVQVEALHKSCFKSTATFSLSIDLGPAGPLDLDASPPWLGSQSPTPGSTVAKKLGAFSFVIGDNESGVDYTTIQVWLDGTLLTVNDSIGYRVEPFLNDLVKVTLGFNPSVGNHTVRAIASHYSTNPSVSANTTVDSSWSYTVVP
jgi:hypothetical protein